MTVKHVCMTQGCNTYTNGGHCDQHRNPNRDTARRERQTRDGRGTAQWQRIRTAILTRDNHTCQLQLDHHCTHTANTVHRINGGYHDDALTNYTSACRHCHGAIDATARRNPTVQHPGGGVAAQASLLSRPAPTAPAKRTVSAGVAEPGFGEILVA